MPRLFLDSTGDPRTLIPAAEAALGRRVDGWIAAVGGEYACPTDAIAWVHNSGRELLCYWEDLDAEQVTRDESWGLLCGQAAIAAATTAGFPASCLPMVGIEAGWSPSVAFIIGLAKAGIRILYASPYAVALQNAFAAARAASTEAAAMSLWSADWLTSGATASPAMAALPDRWAATCAGAAVDVWQAHGNAQTPAGPMDVNWVRDEIPVWEPPAVGTFSDVAPDRWSAPAIATATKAGIVNGYPDGTFHPADPLTREQGAVLAVRTLEAAKGQPVVSTPQPDPVGYYLDTQGIWRPKHGPYGARQSRPTAGLPHHSAWTGSAAPPPANYLDPIVASWLPVEDQSQSQMCLSFVSTEIRRWWAEKLTGDPGKAPLLSPPYHYARAHQLADSTSEGLTGIEGMAALRTYGACLWASDPLPAGGEPLGDAIANSPASLDAEAAAWRINTYGPVDPGDTAAMQQAIMHAPILACIPVPFGGGGIEGPVADGKGGYNVLWPTGAQVAGGHAIVLFGWKTDASGKTWWRLRNSWGASWAENGSAWLDSAHPIWECWSLTCVPVSPLCLQIAQTIAQCEQFLSQLPDMPQTHKDALTAYIADQKAQAQAAGCSA